MNTFPTIQAHFFDLPWITLTLTHGKMSMLHRLLKHLFLLWMCLPCGRPQLLRQGQRGLAERENGQTIESATDRIMSSSMAVTSNMQLQIKHHDDDDDDGMVAAKDDRDDDVNDVIKTNTFQGRELETSDDYGEHIRTFRVSPAVPIEYISSQTMRQLRKHDPQNHGGVSDVGSATNPEFDQAGDVDGNTEGDTFAQIKDNQIEIENSSMSELTINANYNIVQTVNNYLRSESDRSQQKRSLLRKEEGVDRQRALKKWKDIMSSIGENLTVLLKNSYVNSFVVNLNMAKKQQEGSHEGLGNDDNGHGGHGGDDDDD
jgi:hypothetical protein